MEEMAGELVNTRHGKARSMYNIEHSYIEGGGGGYGGALITLIYLKFRVHRVSEAGGEENQREHGNGLSDCCSALSKQE